VRLVAASRGKKAPAGPAWHNREQLEGASVIHLIDALRRGGDQGWKILAEGRKGSRRRPLTRHSQKEEKRKGGNTLIVPLEGINLGGGVLLSVIRYANR